MPKRVKEIEVTFTRKVTLEEKVCSVCQRRFWGAKLKRYCSRACQNKADYARHVATRRQQRLDKYYAEKQG